jgi:hypothetical protein
MKTALITTTINVPRVLSLYRAYDPDVMFFVAGDLKTPDETKEFCDSLGNCVYLHPDEDKHWKLAKFITHNTDSRRNYALLQAMQWKPDLIVSIDDDVIPIGEDIFGAFKKLFYGTGVSVDYLKRESPVEFLRPWDGLMLGAEKQWVNHGSFAVPLHLARGLPYDEQYVLHPGFVVGATIGAAQGIILGTPDSDAATAIAQRPFITSVTDILREGFVTGLASNSVFNSQFTIFRGELAPAFAQFYFAQQRNTDIFSSLLMRRIMRQYNYYTYYGPPFSYHARAPRPLLKDLQAERYGVDNIVAYADYLNRAPLRKNISVVEQCRILAQGWNGPELEAAMAWLDDCEKVLA